MFSNRDPRSQLQARLNSENRRQSAAESCSEESSCTTGSGTDHEASDNDRPMFGSSNRHTASKKLVRSTPR